MAKKDKVLCNKELKGENEMIKKGAAFQRAGWKIEYSPFVQ
jgi:hypothetical protein